MLQCRGGGNASVTGDLHDICVQQQYLKFKQLRSDDDKMKASMAASGKVGPADRNNREGNEKQRRFIIKNAAPDAGRDRPLIFWGPPRTHLRRCLQKNSVEEDWTRPDLHDR